MLSNTSLFSNILATGIFIASMLAYRSLKIKKQQIMKIIICNKCNGNFITDKIVYYNGYYCPVLCNNCHCGDMLVKK